MRIPFVPSLPGPVPAVVRRWLTDEQLDAAGAAVDRPPARPGRWPTRGW